MSNPTSAGELHTFKQAAQSHFAKWALSYDQSRLNELVFYPSVRACQVEVMKWKLAGGRRPFRMLDVGCGTGTLLSLIARDADCERLFGLDYSKEMTHRAAEKFSRSEWAPKLQGLNGDAERLPLAAQSIDIITCCNSFHHYPHQSAAIREFARVLRPGGMLVLIDGFRDNVIGWLVFDVGVTGVEKHVHHASWREFREMITAAGFADVRQRKLNVFAPLLVNVARTN